MEEEINLTQLVPDMKPGSRGLYHIGSRDVRRMGHFTVIAFGKLLAEAAEEADVHLVTKNHNNVLMIGWTPR